MGGGLSNVVYDLSMCGPLVYAAGASGVGVSYFESGVWNALPSLGATVNVVDCFGSDKIYAGGEFQNASSDPDADYLAHYTGSTWEAVGAGFNGGVYAMLIETDGIYAGGAFYYNNGSARPLNRIAYWSPSRWTAFDDGDALAGLNGEVKDVAR